MTSLNRAIIWYLGCTCGLHLKAVVKVFSSGAYHRQHQGHHLGLRNFLGPDFGHFLVGALLFFKLPKLALYH